MSKDHLNSRRILLISALILIVCLRDHTARLIELFQSTGIHSVLRNHVTIPFLQDYDGYLCEEPTYKVRLLSYDPLIMHLENFITPFERQHLLEISGSNLKRSRVVSRNGSRIETKDRTSSSYHITKDDVVSACVKKRVAEFQGFELLSDIEPMQVTAYKLGQEYRPHFDWSGNRRRDRGTTFFGILEADCDNCGTQFPELPVNWTGQDDRWCRIVDCSSDAITVRPLPGSMLFWRNLFPDGVPDMRTLHAGLPLSRGYKTGLNIWTAQMKEPENHEQ